MKKMFLATCLMAASVFAAPTAEDVKAAADQAKPAVEAKAAAAKAKAKTAVKKKATAAKEKAAAAVPTEEVKAAAEQAKAPVADAKAAVEKVPAAEIKTTEAKAVLPVVLPALSPTPAPEAAAPAPVIPAPTPVAEPVPEPAPVIPAPVAEVKAPEPPPAMEVSSPLPAAEEVATTEQQTTTSHKKKKMIENAVFTVNQIDFDINADFELQAGKVLWTSEDDDASNNFEKWTGQANFAILAETENFKGKIGMAFYPGDLKTDIDNKAVANAEDYFTLDEAWAYQSNGWFSFKVGRWDNTDKNGDYFGGYIDGYKYGFLSTQDAENQFEFGFMPNENMDIAISFISKEQHLNKGDLRAVFNFHDLPSLELFEIQLGYRSNIFDKVHDSEADIKHNISLKFRYPVIPNFFTLFGEVALMDASDDMVVPVTGGIELNFKTVDRVILEAEYVNDRYNHKDYIGSKTKHVKDVLGALYLEKALTDRFSLSAGFHSYAASKDYTISGDLIGRIN